jgi:hypothetical protein
MDAADWVGTDRGRALDFDGGNDFITAPSISLGTTHTSSAWVKPNTQVGDFNFGGILGDGTSNTGPLHVSGATDTIFGYTIANGGVDYTGASLTGFWSHIVSVRVSTQVRLYLNGNEVQSGTLPANTAATIARIANRNVTLEYSGQLNDIRIYNRALSPSEIKQLYEGGPGFGLRQERKRSRFQVQGFNAGRYRRQQLIGTGVY